MAEKFTEASAAEYLTKGHTLSPEFAAEVNPILGNLEDDYPIASLLRIFRRRILPPRMRMEEFPNPSSEWRDLMVAQDHQRQVQMGLVLERMLWMGAKTAGRTREMFSKPNDRIRGLGCNVGQPFAFLAFKRIEAPQGE
jgi:hypothetical protein